MTKLRGPTTLAGPTDTEAAAPIPRARRDERHSAFSGRPTTVRLPTLLQRRLAVAAEITDKSISELMREGAELVVDKYVGDDLEEAENTIRAAVEASAARMRELYGLADAG